ncbi:MAG: Ribosome-associated heat shock protein implicated in the recycling of the 50S subunit (S4 paralog) [uncultured Solirubrobacteraceae bacterium]|uniref:Ribosome-associated heat shock protein implicated in the recycling of the 50S subunit (S4 paralog) n=1 Tax=uncultured Solirubrobacteraceae bacterium TaxID=1162706 RepID=A0A6J4T6I7_9ACTN|nr:MAG: Ribosome-associated heat shock protein implicated in the recycling of the 50S subunit (S4 paralog) [uncultured Solirubrobacteraceae bacterium]
MERVRIDKWLWAARFYKSRSLATDAVSGGLAQLNGVRVKPSKEVAAGDELEVTVGQTRRVVIVRGVSERRGPAKEAIKLYEETAQSIAARELAAQQRRLQSPPPGADLGMRPTKRDRRRLDDARGRRR